MELVEKDLGEVVLKMKLSIRRIRCLLAALLILMTVMIPQISEAALKRGSTGDEVKTLQTKLKRWGYYTGVVDGIFGSGTENAVKFFQRKNGLTADGIVGTQTAKALGMQLSSTQTTSSSNSSDLYLLAQCIHGEARGEPYKGQVAVGAVILNRVKSSKFPSSIAGVIYQRGAFDAVSDGQINLKPNDTAIKAAKDAMNGWDPTSGCLYYYNPATATSSWIWSKTVRLRIGRHAFCI